MNVKIKNTHQAIKRDIEFIFFFKLLHFFSVYLLSTTINNHNIIQQFERFANRQR